MVLDIGTLWHFLCRAMRNLPFVVQPKRKPEPVRVGTETSGYFELQRLGYLSVGEKAAYQQVVTNKEGVQVLRALVNKVATEQGMAVDKAHDLISKLLQSQKLTKKEEQTLEIYTQDILEMLEVFSRETVHTQMIMATVLLISRLDPEWTIDDTSKLEPDVIAQLAELFQAEENRSLGNLSFLQTKEEPSQGKEEPQEPQPAT